MRYDDDYISYRTRLAPSITSPVISFYDSGDYEVGVRIPVNGSCEPTTWVTYCSIDSLDDDEDRDDHDYYPGSLSKKTKWDWVPSLGFRCKVTYSPSLMEEMEKESIILEKDKKGGWKILHILPGFKSKKAKGAADIKNSIDAEIYDPKEFGDFTENESPVDAEIRRRMKSNRRGSFMGFFNCGRGPSPSSSAEPEDKKLHRAETNDNTLSYCDAIVDNDDEIKTPVKEGLFSRTLNRFQTARRRSSASGKKVDLKGKDNEL
ncbi:hypothetical protein BZA77DRAFT_355624 [Pyronema omphalodes]|nr:hypothetical protein BZA77DRAFT_355624 [Pyronema omphalodes]